MKIRELIDDMRVWNDLNFKSKETVDQYLTGDMENEIKKVGVTMFASIEVIKKAIQMGINLLIVHEPTFYSNEETVDLNNPVHRAKKELLENAGITVFRYHDHPHCMKGDLIDISTIKYSGLKGTITGKPHWAITEFVLDEELTGSEVRAILRDKLNAQWSRIAGATDKKGKVIAFACGTPGHIMELLLDDRTDFIVTGEVCEWIYGEFARDLAALGKNKALIIMGHCRSEYAGMIEVSRIIQEKFPQLEVHHLESGDVYQ